MFRKLTITCIMGNGKLTQDLEHVRHQRLKRWEKLLVLLHFDDDAVKQHKRQSSIPARAAATRQPTVKVSTCQCRRLPAPGPPLTSACRRTPAGSPAAPPERAKLCCLTNINGTLLRHAQKRQHTNTLQVRKARRLPPRPRTSRRFFILVLISASLVYTSFIRGYTPLREDTSNSLWK